MANQILYQTSLDDVAWDDLKTTLASDSFDNGRTPVQLQKSFENSFATVIARQDDCIIGTARALSDGVCNAYIVDVWTLSTYRNQGVGRRMMELLLERLRGQHVYLFTADTVDFYKKLAFREQPVGLGRVVGEWLRS